MILRVSRYKLPPLYLLDIAQAYFLRLDIYFGTYNSAGMKIDVRVKRRIEILLQSLEAGSALPCVFI